MQPTELIKRLDKIAKEAELAIAMIENEAQQSYLEGHEGRATMLVERCSCIKIGVIYPLEKLKEELMHGHANATHPDKNPDR